MVHPAGGGCSNQGREPLVHPDRPGELAVIVMRTCLAVDIHLLALAVAQGGCAMTLDHGVAATTVPGATARRLEHLWRRPHADRPHCPWPRLAQRLHRAAPYPVARNVEVVPLTALGLPG